MALFCLEGDAAEKETLTITITARGQIDVLFQNSRMQSRLIGGVLKQDVINSLSYGWCPYGTFLRLNGMLVASSADQISLPFSSHRCYFGCLPMQTKEYKTIDLFHGLIHSIDISDHLPETTPAAVGNDTKILTPLGMRPVENLKCGDLIITRDRGPMRIEWIGRSDVGPDEIETAAHLIPVCLDATPLGGKGEITLSQNARIWLRPQDALAKARNFADLGIGRHRFLHGACHQTYWQIMLKEHALIAANGVWIETMYPGASPVAGLSAASALAYELALDRAEPEKRVRPLMTRSTLAGLFQNPSANAKKVA